MAKPGPPEGEPPDAKGGNKSENETLPERGRFERTREMIELATPLVATLLTLGSALLTIAVERLPTLQPIGVVLVAFLAFLTLSALVQFLLYWRDLATLHARAEFLRTLSFGGVLVGVTVAGLLARYFWELFQSGRSVSDADPAELALPLLVSLMVFYPLWTAVSGTTRNFFTIVAAFQNGFFWQTLFSGLRPFVAASFR
jgi:hypothetical protein